MKRLRQVSFEPLEKRDLFASDFSLLGDSHGHHDDRGPKYAEFSRSDDLQNHSTFDLGRMHGVDDVRKAARALIVDDHHGLDRTRDSRLPPSPLSGVAFPLSQATYAGSFNLAIKVRPVVPITVTVVQPSLSNVEGEAASVNNSIFPRSLPIIGNTISILIPGNRALPSPNESETRSASLDLFTPNALRASTTGIDTQSRRSTTPAIGESAPAIEVQRKLEARKTESTSDRSVSEFQLADHALQDLALVDEIAMDAIAKSRLSERTNSLEVPVPKDMLSLDLGRGFLWNSRGSSANDSWPHLDTRYDGSRSHNMSSHARQTTEVASLVDSPLPIPTGMIYLDLAIDQLSTVDATLPMSIPVLQAGINPLTLFQTFVNAQPITGTIHLRSSDSCERMNDESDSNSLSLTSIGIVAALSGFLFAISQRTRQSNRSPILRRAMKESPIASH